MNDKVNNPYQSPSADLIDNDLENPIFLFKRFTAWGVFGLGIITLGIYTIYWLCSRAGTINAMHKNQIGELWISGLVISTFLSFLSGAFGPSDAALFAEILISLVYIVTYIAVSFKIKYRLEEVMNQNSQAIYKIGPVLTFFFSAIYLQYKINEYIDTNSGNMLLSDN